VSRPHGRLYTARADDDLRAVCEWIRGTRSPPALYAVGFSMGANQLLCFLGGGGGASLVDAAVSVSCPFDFNKLSVYYRSGTAKLYGALVVQPLKALLWSGRHQLRLSRQQLWRGMSAMSVEEFDAQIQVPLLGLSNVEEYYSYGSSAQFVRSISTPLLVVHALDDPLVPPNAVPQAALQAESQTRAVGSTRDVTRDVRESVRRRLPRLLAALPLPPTLSHEVMRPPQPPTLHESPATTPWSPS